MLIYHRGTVRRAMSVEILSTAAQLYEKSHLEKRLLTLKVVMQGHWNCLYLIGHISLPTSGL